LSRTRSEGSNGAEDPARLRAEIAETRKEMSGTIEELHGRLNPVVLKEQALEQFHEATETIKKELKERLQDAKQSLLAELKEVKETVRVDVREEIDTVKSRLTDEVVQAKTAVRDATIGKVENIMQDARERVRDTGRSVREVVADNPIPAALASVGLAWLFVEGRRRRTSRREREMPERRMLYSGIERESYATGAEGYEQQDFQGQEFQGQGEDTSIRGRMRDVGQEAGRKVSEATQQARSTVRDAAQDAKESVSELAQRGRERASELTREAKDKASELSRGAERQARRIQRRSNELYRENPIAVGAALLAAGTIIGLAMPRTSLENQRIGGAREKVVGKAQELAHKAFGKAEEAVKRIGESDETEGKGQGRSPTNEPGHEFH